VGVEVPGEGRLMIQRRHMEGPVIPAPSRHPAQRVQAVGQRGARHRGEPAVADRELLGQVIVDGHVGAVVVPHDAARVAVLNPPRGKGSGRTGHKATHGPVGDLGVDRARGMVRVDPQGRRGEVVHRVGAPLVLVGQAGAQAVDLWASAGEGQVAEHVIKGPVLQHHDHNVVDLLQVGGIRVRALVSCHSPSVGQVDMVPGDDTQLGRPSQPHTEPSGHRLSR